MRSREKLDPENFYFRGLHPDVWLGTASDRYGGWLGQIYSSDRYGSQIRRRTKTVGSASFVEEVLPVASVAEYFKHFRVLELDFTFYRPLLEADGRPSSNYRILQKYRDHLRPGDALILKVPQVVFAHKLWQGGEFRRNEAYLNPEAFRRQFYEPAVEILGPFLSGLIFEQEYQRQKDRLPARQVAAALDEFFARIPTDSRYHVELRTESYLSAPVFEVLARHGVGQVLSHWTWLPSLRRQHLASGGRFFNGGGQAVVRLMTPRGVRYDEAYARAHPFKALVEGMQSPKMVRGAAALMWDAIEAGVKINVIVNNRAGGNAPLIAQQIARRFQELAGSRRPES